MERVTKKEFGLTTEDREVIGKSFDIYGDEIDMSN